MDKEQFKADNFSTISRVDKTIDRNPIVDIEVPKNLFKEDLDTDEEKENEVVLTGLEKALLDKYRTDNTPFYIKMFGKYRNITPRQSRRIRERSDKKTEVRPSFSSTEEIVSVLLHIQARSINS